eukprot:TRINITY_DN1094_c0_g1_i2.p1 TRINITY_DN1094_c0_g1~~TRINITY_DN1094_c0_g1_i2.p1  ORF type:complete len:229 (-),score=29.32 TRINITY_DN1094_c0_g1_i2:36-722(-)
MQGGGFPGYPGGFPPGGGGGYLQPHMSHAPPGRTTTVQITRTNTTFNNNWYAPYYNQIQGNQGYMQNLQYWFNAVDRDRSGTITAQELAQVQFNQRPLGFPCAVKILRAFDKDNSGTIDFREYVALHGFLQTISNAFLMADRDRSGTLDAYEIYNALVGAGFQLSQPTVSAICRRYSNTAMGLTFDYFLMAVAHLAIVRSIFEWNDVSRVGRISLTFDQLANITIECL